MDLLLRSLQRRQYGVLKEPYIPTPTEGRKPDLVLWKDGQATIVDVQIVSAASASSLTSLHQMKVRKYSTEPVIDWVKAQTGATEVTVGSMTINWRGIIALESFRLARQLGVPVADLRLMAVRVLESTANMWKMYRRVTSTRNYDALFLTG
jgi:hypothetical protein